MGIVYLIRHRIYQIADNLAGIDGVELSDKWEVAEASLLMYYLEHICVSQMAYSESIEKSKTELDYFNQYHEQLSDVNVTDKFTNSSEKIVAVLKKVNHNTLREEYKYNQAKAVLLQF
jgi:hypothetical protein